MSGGGGGGGGGRGPHKNACVVMASGGRQECGPQSQQCRSRARDVFPPIYLLPVRLQSPALSATPVQPWKNGGNKTKQQPKKKKIHLFMVPSEAPASASVFLRACGLRVEGNDAQMKLHRVQQRSEMSSGSHFKSK